MVESAATPSALLWSWNPLGTFRSARYKGKIVGDTLELIPALPAPPPGMAPALRVPEALHQGDLHQADRRNQVQQALPAERLRPPDSDSRSETRNTYTHVSRTLSGLRCFAPPGASSATVRPIGRSCKHPPMGWNSWNKFQTKLMTRRSEESPMRWSAVE